MPRAAARPALLLPALLLLLARAAAAEGPDDTWCAPFQRGPGCEDVLLDACVAAADRATLLLGDTQPEVTAVLDGCQAPYQVENRVRVLVPQNAAAAVRKYAPRFEAATGTAVEVRVMNDLTAGNLPGIVKALRDNAGDVVVFDSKLLPGLVDLPGDGTPDTALTDLTDIMAADKGFAWADIFPFLRRFTASYRAHTSHGSRVFAVPLSVDLVYLFYRRDLLEAAGLDVPATWDDYLRVAAALDGVEEGGRRVHGSCLHSNCAPARYYLDVVSSLTQARGTKSGSLLAPQDLSMLFDSAAGTRAFDILNATRDFHVGDGGETCPDDGDAAFDSGSEFDLALMAGNEHFRRVPSFARGECALALADRGQLLLMAPPEEEVDFQWSVAQVPCSPVVLNRTAEDPSSAAALAECVPNDQVQSHAGSEKHLACPYAASRGSYAGLNCAPQSHGSILASINVFSPKQAMAWSFLSFMGGKEVALEGLAERGFVGEFLFRTSTAKAYEKVLQERLLTETDPAARQTAEADAQILGMLQKTMNDPNVVQQPNYPGLTELIRELTKTLKALFEGGSAARGLSRFAAEWNVIIDNFGRAAYTQQYQQSIGYTGPRTATAGGGASSNLGLLVGLPVALVVLAWAVMATWAVWRHRRRRRHLRRPPGPPVGDADTGLTPPLTTFVFTDIQNSTKLWESDPAAMRAAVQLHNKVLRGEMLVCGGTLSATEGDGWTVCFHSPTDALAFCLRAQRALLAAPWPPALLALEGMGEVRGPAFADYGNTTIHEELGPASASFAEVLDAWGGDSRRTRKRGGLLAWLAGAGGAKSRAKSARATAKKVRSSTGSVGDSPVLFRGLRVRMGLHCGPALARRNGSAYEYSGGSVLVAREVGDAGEGGTVMMTGSAFSRVDLGALRALLELGRPQRPDHGGNSPLALFHAGQYALDLDLSMPVSTRTSQHGTISREPSGQDLEGGLGADPAPPPAKSLEPSPSRWWHKTMGRSIVVDRGPAAGPALVPRGAIRANLLCTYPPELAGRGPLHGTMLRRGRQLSPHVLCAPTGDVTLVFAAFSTATTRALMARDAELGESSIAASMQYLEAACLRFYGYEIELAPGFIYAAFAESGDALAFACAVQQELMDVGWPEGVLAMAECAELEVRGESAAVSRRTERVTVFRGPRIAVGIAAGHPGADAVVHHGTGRATYPGILANRAARISGLAAPGQTLCNVEAFESAEASEAAGFDATDLGSIRLKGVKEPVEIMWVHTPLLQQRPVPKLKPGA